MHFAVHDPPLLDPKALDDELRMIEEIRAT
jgi:hypothetical protein